MRWTEQRNFEAVLDMMAATLIADQAINVVVITTRHDSHADFVCEALKAGKHVFVEKPLALSLEELQRIEDVYTSMTEIEAPPPLLMVGFNRRFTPQVRKIMGLLAGVRLAPCTISPTAARSFPRRGWRCLPRVGFYSLTTSAVWKATAGPALKR